MPTRTPPDVRRLIRRLDACTLADARRLRRRLRGLDKPGRRTEGRRREELVAQIGDQIAASGELVEKRRAAIPKIAYPEELPVSGKRGEIAEAIDRGQVTVICGETGSGKTTQLPKICLELGRGVRGMIGHTQPRRIAARSVADRIAEELGVATGGVVGYKVRFGDQTREDTLVKLMTDGVLLAEIPRDRLLDAYDTIIIDEAHERSLNIDFLLGYLRSVLHKRPDLKVIITSATIDPERFAEHFAEDGSPAPIVEVSGRTYPVELRYRALGTGEGESAQRGEADPIGGVLDAMAEIDLEPPSHGQPSDVLVFMPGEREIRETANALRRRYERERSHANVEILPLYARLSVEEQKRVFRPHPGRRIVIATNVAETSLTVPGIRYVIDPGNARISRYSARTKVQGLPTEAISRASADQRKGRCGRVGPGVCYRLYSEADFDGRERFTTPEILRTNLASVVLQMAALGLGAPEHFPFVEPPDYRLIRDGYETLRELGAVDADHRLTELGGRLARLPIDPRIGRMILAATDEGALSEVIIIAAALASQDPRDRPQEKQDEADRAHEKFAVEGSDFLSFLEIWHFYHDSIRPLTRRQRVLACRENFLSERRLREWADVVGQLRSLCAELKMRPNSEPAEAGAIHRSLLTGLLTSIGRRDEGHEYAGPRSLKFHIHPGSSQFREKPAWLMSAELVRTTRLYARTVAAIQPEWVERLGGHLLKRTYSNPRWETKSQRVVADEKVTMLGLEIIPKRKVGYGPIDAAASRELFIHHALVGDEYKSDAECLEHNRRLIDQVGRLEDKARRRDLLAEHSAMFRFFDERLPPDVWSGRSFERWRARAEAGDPKLLFMTLDDVLAGEPGVIETDEFPDDVEIGGRRVAVEYRFDPGEAHDGATVDVPVEALTQLTPADTDRLVPGLLAKRVEALMRTMPKGFRRHFDIAPLAKELAPSLAGDPRPLDRSLAEALARRAGVPIGEDDFRAADLPEHLSVRLRVVGEDGAELASGRDLAALQSSLAERARAAVAEAASDEWRAEGLQDWGFDALPESVELSAGSRPVRGYPALLDRGDSVSLRLLDSKGAAEWATRAGLARLYSFRLRRDMKWQARRQPQFPMLTVYYAPFGPKEELARDIECAVASALLIEGREVPGDYAAFTARLDAGWQDLGRVSADVLASIGETMKLASEIRATLEAELPPAVAHAERDMNRQLAGLFERGFIASQPFARLRGYRRYLTAMKARLGRLRGADMIERDRNHQAELYLWQTRYEDRRDSHDRRGIVDPELIQLRWLLEEYRVRLFDPSARVPVKISPNVLEKQFERVLD
ncbi:MAG: ATP-dependent RNA helicase HrpA [Planctomycetota bacterium]